MRRPLLKILGFWTAYTIPPTLLSFTLSFLYAIHLSFVGSRYFRICNIKNLIWPPSQKGGVWIQIFVSKDI